MAVLEDSIAPRPASAAIAQQKRAETALEESEAILRELLATLNLGSFMARDFGGVIRFWSAGCERLYGWTAAEAVGQVSHDLLRTVHPVPLAEIEAALERDGEWTGDLRHRTRDGAEIIVTARKALRHGPDGRPVAVLESLTDVTAQRQAEAALAGSEARLTAELRAMSRLHELGARLLDAPDVTTAAREVLDAVIALVGADLGTVQIHDPAVNGLRFVAQRGFDPLALDAVGVICDNFHSTCARALRSGARVVVEDFRADPDAAAHRPTADALGYRAAQSTPLRTRGGEILGVLTTHFRQPHAPDERELRLIDLFARHAAHLMERARAEAALRESEARWRGLFESMHEGFVLGEIVHGADGRGAVDDFRFLEVNAAFERQSGLPAAAVVGRLVTEAVPGIEPFWIETYARVAGTGEPAHVEYYAAPLGRWFEAFAYRTEPGRFASLFLDITERKRAEEALRRSRAEAERERRLYEAILTNTPDHAYVFDLDHRFTYANDVLLRMWGKTRAEAIGRNCLELGYEPWQAARHGREIEQVIATRQPIQGEVPFTGTFGRRIYDYILVPVIGPDGSVEAVAGTTRDVTERKQAEEQRLLLAREVDHRAKNALAVVQALLRLTPSDDEAVRRFAASMTGRVSAMARAHALLSQERWAGAELRALAGEELAPFAAGEPDRVRLDGPSLRLGADAAQSFSMVLHELATNAAKYGALSVPGGRLDLHWRVEDGGTLILRWTETGGPPLVAAPARSGFGSRLVGSSLRQIGGSERFDWRPEGLRCTLRVPVERLGGAAAD